MNILVGIDFGTTNTVISIFDNNKSKPLLDGVYRTIPSKIGRVNKKFYCGNYIPLGVSDVINSFKIEIGHEYEIERNKKAKKITFYKEVTKTIKLQKLTSLNEIEERKYQFLRGLKLLLR
jgi:molecular chaperone DnaK (HSP70)